MLCTRRVLARTAPGGRWGGGEWRIIVLVSGGTVQTATHDNEGACHAC